MTHRQRTTYPETSACLAPRLSGSGTKVLRETRENRPLVVLLLPLIALGFLIPTAHPQNIFDCSAGFTNAGSSGAGSNLCAVAVVGEKSANWALAGSGVSSFSGSSIVLQPAGDVHDVVPLIYQTPVNVEAFTASFQFTTNGETMSFALQNNNNPHVDGGASHMVGGAGGEGGIFQGFGALPPSPNNIWAIQFDSYSPLTQTGSFSYSSVQMYQQNQLPALPAGNADIPGWPTDKFSTYPVPFNSPTTSRNTTTGDTYSATITYDGSNVILNLYDLTAGGSCPGAHCFTQEWSNVSIPSLVGGTTAYFTLTSATGTASVAPLSIMGASYTVNTPATLPGSTPPVAGAKPAANPTFAPAAGTYSATQSVTISCPTPSSNICYSVGASGLVMTPVPNNMGGCGVGTAYSSPITILSGQTLYASCGTTYTGLPSGVTRGTYTVSSLPAASTPTFMPAGGIYTSAQSVTVFAATSGATIYYTTDGSTPTTSSNQYTGPIAVGSTETLQAISVATGDSNSAVGSASYTINLVIPAAATPAFSPAAGTYTSAQTVTISDATTDATVYYTTDGSTPTTSSTEYSGPVTVSASETLNAIAVAMGNGNSAVASSSYIINFSLPSVATPTFSPGGGAYTSPQSVTLADTTAGAKIYYTTNGTAPTTSSTAYSGPIAVSATETLQTFAVAPDDTNSGVASAAYTITTSLPSVATPTFSPAGGTYNSAQSVTIADATSGATIYYTIDGSIPTSSSTPYTGPIAVGLTETLQAIAAGSSDSAIGSAVYTITAQPNFMLGTSVSALTVNPGGQGTVMVTVTPENGFNSPVVLACTGLPTWATCSFGESTVTPSTGAATTQLIISASAQTSALQPGTRTVFPFTALAMTVCFFGWKRRRGWHHWLLLVVAYAGLGLLFGCGGTATAGGNSSSASATSTVTVTAISGSLKGSAAIAITVN